MLKRLTQSYIVSIKPDENKPLWISDSEVKNLKLYVGTSGSKTWYLYYRDKDDRKASKKLGSFDALTVAQARDMAKDIGGRIVRGENVRKEKPKYKITYDDFLSNFYEPWVVANRRTGRETMKIIKSNFGFLEQTPIEDLSVLELEQWRTKRIGEGMKAPSLNRVIVALKASINWAVEHEIIKENPLFKLRPLREDDSDKKVRYLSPEERERLYAELNKRNDHLKPMVIISLNTGIRQGSLLMAKAPNWYSLLLKREERWTIVKVHGKNYCRTLIYKNSAGTI